MRIIKNFLLIVGLLLLCPCIVYGATNSNARAKEEIEEIEEVEEETEKNDSLPAVLDRLDACINYLVLVNIFLALLLGCLAACIFANFWRFR